jgi:hypothetical protein
MPTSWSITVDWDRNGNYNDTYDDVTNRVISADWFLGMREAYQDDADDSMLRLVLDNSDKRFSPEYASGPLYGKLAPFRTVRIQSDDGTTIRTHWVGWVEEIQPNVNQYGERTARITAAGPMLFFKSAETNIDLQENQRTDQIISKLIQEVVIPPALTTGWLVEMQGYGELGISTYLANVTAYQAVDTGRVTLAIAADNWVQRPDSPNDKRDTYSVYRAIADVTAAERGRFLFDREGKAIFWNRSRLQDNIPPSVTLSDSMNDLDYSYAGLSNFRNDVVVTCHPRLLSALTNDVLWQLNDDITIPVGKTYNVAVRYQDINNSNLRIGAMDVTVTDIAFSEGNAAVVLEPHANSATLKITNAGNIPATLTACTVKGRKITDYGRMEAQAKDTLSIAKYGRRSMKLNLMSVDTFDDAQSIADYEVKRRGQPRGMVSEVILRSHGKNGGGYHAHQLAYTLGNTVTLSETQSGHTNRRYLIIGESHRLLDGATMLETTWYLEPATESPFPWKLDVSGRSELGGATYLAF